MSDEHEEVTAPETPRGKKITSEVKRLSQSERVRNYFIGIGALTGLILGLVAQFKGEPVAEKTWTTLRTQVNEISVAVNKLSRRVVFLQAHEAGRTAAEVQLRLEAVQKERDALLAAQAARKAVSTPQAAPTSAGAEQKCGDGHLPVAGRCQRVPVAVAKKVKADEAALLKKLEEEKKRSLELEARKQQLMKQLKQPAPPVPPPALRSLPKKLEDADKKSPLIEGL